MTKLGKMAGATAGYCSTAVGRAVVGSAGEQETICAGDEAHSGYQDDAIFRLSRTALFCR